MPTAPSNEQIVYTTETEDGLFIFKTLELAKESFKLTYSKHKSPLIFKSYEQPKETPIAVYYNNKIVGFIHKNYIRESADHL